MAKEGLKSTFINLEVIKKIKGEPDYGKLMMLYMELLICRDYTKNTCHISLESLTKELRLGRTTLVSLLSKLESLNLIAVVPGSFGQKLANTYTFPMEGFGKAIYTKEENIQKKVVAANKKKPETKMDLVTFTELLGRYVVREGREGGLYKALFTNDIPCMTNKVTPKMIKNSFADLMRKAEKLDLSYIEDLCRKWLQEPHEFSRLAPESEWGN